MRIAVWVETEVWGGVDDHLRMMSQNWNSNDEICIFSNREFPISSDMELSHLIYIKTINSRLIGKKARRWIESFILPLHILTSTKKAKKMLNRYGPFDAFIADNGGYPGSWSTIAALRAAYRIGIKKRLLIVHHQAISPRVFRQSIELVIDRKIQNWAQRVVTVSQATRKTLIERRGFDSQRLPVSVIWCGVEFDQSIKSDDFNLRSQLSVGGDTTIIGIMGRLDEHKGHADVIHAMALLPAEIKKNLVLAVIGGSETSQISRLTKIAENAGVGDQVQFLGYLNHPAQAIIEQLDLLISATQDFEGFGLTVAEAMACETPVIATDVGAITEFCSSDMARIINPGNVDAISEAIIDYFDNEAKTSLLVSNAKLQSLLLTPKLMADRIKRELDRCVENNL